MSQAQGMRFATKPSKYFFEKRLVDKLKEDPKKRVRMLELGGGTSEIGQRLLEQFPFAEYVSIEPDAESVVCARERFAGNERATVLLGLGYGDIQHPVLNQPFDVVFSLSVLEHVKNLRRFIHASITHVRSGGDVIHLYDLGHALYPCGIKEWIQTKICRSPLLQFVPEQKVARYLTTKEVVSLLEPSCEIDEITFHNMPNHVALLKCHMTESCMRDIVAFESTYYTDIDDLRIREHLFPSICFWAKKR